MGVRVVEEGSGSMVGTVNGCCLGESSARDTIEYRLAAHMFGTGGMESDAR